MHILGNKSWSVNQDNTIVTLGESEWVGINRTGLEEKQALSNEFTEK